MKFNVSVLFVVASSFLGCAADEATPADLSPESEGDTASVSQDLITCPTSLRSGWTNLYGGQGSILSAYIGLYAGPDCLVSGSRYWAVNAVVYPLPTGDSPTARLTSGWVEQELTLPDGRIIVTTVIGTQSMGGRATFTAPLIGYKGVTSAGRARACGSVEAGYTRPAASGCTGWFTLAPTAPDTKFADVNGDGRADRIVRGRDNRFWVELATSTGFNPAQHWMTHGGTYHSADQAKYADLNADGKADLIFQGTDNRFWVSLSTGSGFTTPQNWVSHGGSYIVGQATYADLNNDRKADLTFRGADNRYWVSYSTGTGFTPPALRR